MALNSNSTHNLAVTQETQKHFVILDDGSYCPVPEGADADFIRQTKNRALANKASGAKRTSRTGRSQNSRRTNYAAQVLSRTVATLEMVNRVNGKPEESTVFFNGEVMYV